MLDVGGWIRKVGVEFGTRFAGIDSSLYSYTRIVRNLQVTRVQVLRNTLFVPLAFLAILVTIQSSPAAGGRATIKGGQEILLHAYALFKPLDCKSFNVTVKVVKRPEQGKLRQVNGSIDPAKGYTTGFHANRCNGTQIRAKLFYYRAPKGFRGTAHIILRPVGIMGGRNQHFYITVK